MVKRGPLKLVDCGCVAYAKGVVDKATCVTTLLVQGPDMVVGVRKNGQPPFGGGEHLDAASGRVKRFHCRCHSIHEVVPFANVLREDYSHANVEGHVRRLWRAVGLGLPAWAVIGWVGIVVSWNGGNQGLALFFKKHLDGESIYKGGPSSSASDEGRGPAGLLKHALDV